MAEGAMSGPDWHEESPGPLFPPPKTTLIGPAVHVTTELPKDYVRWAIMERDGRRCRCGILALDDMKPHQLLAWARAEAKKWDATLVTAFLEPSFDHNGYYDPSGGFFWEDEYAAWQAKLAAKIGPWFAPFVTCPECEASHTAPTRSCRKCGFQMP